MTSFFLYAREARYGIDYYVGWFDSDSYCIFFPRAVPVSLLLRSNT